jgi:hypothetical protein
LLSVHLFLTLSELDDERMLRNVSPSTLYMMQLVVVMHVAVRAQLYMRAVTPQHAAAAAKRMRREGDGGGSIIGGRGGYDGVR